MRTDTVRMNDTTEARLTELEIKASFSDDLLEQLNATVARQQAQIELLHRELLALRNQMREGQSGLGGAVDERPPHY